MLPMLLLLSVLTSCSLQQIEDAPPGAGDDTETPTLVPDLDSLLVAVLSFDDAAPSASLRRLARTVRATSEWYGVDPLLIAQIIRIESLADSAAVHRPITVQVAGKGPVRTRAVGLGGIVPELWLGVFPECGRDLRRVRENVCYTVRVWQWFRDRYEDRIDALLAYNGCRRGWSCDWYANAVLMNVD